ncbi:MAG: UvrD-helicase domain-containing protein [Candidatus Thorarchaeota archaeon]
MSYRPHLKNFETPPLHKDQKAAFQSYFVNGQVCVDAGAGTGKTHTLVEIASEIIVSQSSTSNPFKRTLVVTFGVEASREMKTRIRKRLLDHKKAGGILPKGVFRYLESESDIETIDALILSLVSETAMDLGISLTTDIGDTLAEQEMVNGILESLLSDPTIRDAWDQLLVRYPDSHRPFGPEPLRNMLWESYQKMREFCWDIAKVRQSLEDGLKKMHANHAPPFNIQDIEHIIMNARGSSASLPADQASYDKIVSMTERVYKVTQDSIQKFMLILEKFDELYDRVTRARGIFTYTDLAFLVWRYMQTKDGQSWREDLSNRYDHILIDEYQDTSYVQNEILSAFMRDDGKQDFTRVLFIGDVKQSIYQWRSAEPGIFMKIINTLQSGQNLPTPLARMVRSPLITNFRSHEDLVHFSNAVFSEIFDDPLTGAVSGSVPYEYLEPSKTRSKSHKDAHIHVLTCNARKTKSWAEEESNFIADIILGSISTLASEDGHAYQPSDVALLFRRTSYIPVYVNTLRKRGLKCAVLTDTSLFEETEISLLVDVLDWLSNPNSKDSLLRILRSPIVALDDKTLRFLVSKKFYLTSALRSWPQGELSDEDKIRLEQLAQLREDVRWDREGSKADLIAKIIAHSFLDTVVSAGGLQAHANLWLLTELSRSWESEELMRYDDFVARLKRIRDDSTGRMRRDFPRAILADEQSKDSIKIMTIHRAKGLEFPIVFLCDSVAQTGIMATRARMVRSRSNGIILKPTVYRGTQSVGGFVTKQSNGKPLDWISPQSDSLLWVSPSRSPRTGRFFSSAPWQGALFEEQAEFWRLLYVAITRAKNHLFFSVGAEDDKGELVFKPVGVNANEFPWTSWMPVLRRAVKYNQLRPGSIQSLSFVRKGSSTSDSILIGLDELKPTRHSPPVKPSYSYQMGSATQKLKYNVPKFVPASISASSCGILIECPRRYQYELLWRVSRTKEKKQRSKHNIPSSLPSEINPDVWGTCVHELLEQRDFSTTTDQDPTIEGLLDPSYKTKYTNRFGKNLLDKMREAVSNFDSSTIYQELHDCIENGRDYFKEFKVHAVLEPDNMPGIPIDGRVDLLYEQPSGAKVAVDYKAEMKPPVGSYISRIHEMQLSAYAWLLEKHYGWSVAKCAVVYLYPQLEVFEFTPDPRFFENRLETALQNLIVDGKRGLTVKPSLGPNGTCTLCPYAKSVGGPCEHG